MIHFIYFNLDLYVQDEVLDLLTIGILVLIVCIDAVSVTDVMTYLKLQDLTKEFRMAHRL